MREPDPLDGYALEELEDLEDDHEFQEGEEDCFHCGGEGWDECDDPIECTQEHRFSTGGGGVLLQYCRCASCGGSGKAKDMTIW